METTFLSWVTALTNSMLMSVFRASSMPLKLDTGTSIQPAFTETNFRLPKSSKNYKSPESNFTSPAKLPPLSKDMNKQNKPVSQSFKNFNVTTLT
jgi:hypothetical protein